MLPVGSRGHRDGSREWPRRWCPAATIRQGEHTRGTGELIAVARRQGFKRILVAVGGSATTDGGLAAVEALGWSLQGIEVTVACDVESAFLDAATIYGPQKGASPAQVALLTRRLQRLADQYRTRTGVDVTASTSARARRVASRVGLAAIGAQLVPGFDAVADAVGLEAACEGAAIVVTGEGKLDPSSLEGKVVGGVLGWASDLAVPHVAVIAGQGDRRSARPARRPRSEYEVLALTEGAWASRRGVPTPLPLVEEAAVEAARSIASS